MPNWLDWDTRWVGARRTAPAARIRRRRTQGLSKSKGSWYVTRSRGAPAGERVEKKLGSVKLAPSCSIDTMKIGGCGREVTFRCQNTPSSITSSRTVSDDPRTRKTAPGRVTFDGGLFGP